MQRLNSSRWPLRVGTSGAVQASGMYAGRPAGSGFEAGGNRRRPASGTVWQRGEDAGACVALGKMYVEGKGVPSNAKVISSISAWVEGAGRGYVPARRTLCDGSQGSLG